MLSRQLPRFSERMTSRELVAALNNLVEALAPLAGPRAIAPPLGQMPGSGALYLDDTQYKRIPARLTGVNSVAITGQPNQLRYAFVQQTFNPTTGEYSDYTPGLIGDGVLTYATEVNNQAVGEVFTSTIPASANTPPLVWLRSKGIIDGRKVYEFDASFPAVIAVLNSGIPNVDGLYDATIQFYDPAGETWTSGPTIWLRDANS